MEGKTRGGAWSPFFFFAIKTPPGEKKGESGAKMCSFLVHEGNVGMCVFVFMCVCVEVSFMDYNLLRNIIVSNLSC